MGKVTVFVTGVGGSGLGEQILKALRMAETGYTVIGADMSPYSIGLLKVDHAYILPPAADPEYIDTVLRICKKHGVSALFHGSDSELKVMSQNRQLLESQGLFLPINPSAVLELCLDKGKTFEFLCQNGFLCPRFRQVLSIADLSDFNIFPAVLKPSRGSSGSTNTFIAQTREELLCFGRYLLSIYPEFIVQEYIGTPDCEYTAGVLLSMDGELINSIAVKRNILSGLSNRLKIPNRTENSELGPYLALSSGISQGEIGSFPEVTRPCEQIALAVGARGPLNIQCRLVDGKVYVLEINPRFSGTTSLRAMVGFNEPDVLIRRHVLKEHIEPHFPYKTGMILRGLSEALIDHLKLPGERI
ncbi:MAG TPA: ATP-grasp domain-containing protein [archaeon]|nr:ATP-grasp domain-containing protein [archaeon]